MFFLSPDTLKYVYSTHISCMIASYHSFIGFTNDSFQFNVPFFRPTVNLDNLECKKSSIAHFYQDSPNRHLFHISRTCWNSIYGMSSTTRIYLSDSKLHFNQCNINMNWLWTPLLKWILLIQISKLYSLYRYYCYFYVVGKELYLYTPVVMTSINLIKISRELVT